ncbi:MAG: EAL domain-containing protein [Desulfuromonadales bacterium]
MNRLQPLEKSLAQTRFDLIFLATALFWSVLILVLADLNYRQISQALEESARTAARHSIAKDLTYRLWATRHGGVYVPTSDAIRPSANLAHIPERDLTTPSGKLLTLVNPAWMTRQVHEMAEEEFGTRGHITSLKPLRPENAPDAWERGALLAFEQGQAEDWTLTSSGEETYLRLMRPMVTRTECLKCHAKQGYQTGDIRGGISVTVPWQPYAATLLEHRRQLLYGYGGIWFFGILSLVFGRFYLHRLLAHRKKAELAAQESSQQFQILFESMAEGVALNELIRDETGQPVDYRLLDTNPAFEKQTGIPPARARGALGSQLFGTDPPLHLAEFARVEQTGEPFVLETYFPLLERHFSVSVVSPARGRFATVFDDITRRKEYEGQLAYQATHDLLTGLANRALLTDRIQQSILFAERSQRIVAILLLDLDRFKIVNDSLGHGRGDELLQQVALRLSGCIRECDTVARLGGDEFVVVLAEIACLDDVGLLAKKIMDSLAATYRLENREVFLTASAGISVFPRDGREPETLIRNADSAMYRAKEEPGFHFAFFAPEMNARAWETLELEEDLRHALKQEEFVLHFQPKIDMASGRIAGCEALVRWRHPVRGMLQPDHFIPLAEETGLIVNIDSWVLGEACRHIQGWRSAGFPSVKVAVNMSAKHFGQIDLPNQVRATLAEYAVDPGLLELELTESMIMANPVRAAETMCMLKDIGLSLVLDDFGTGYSSLSYLSRFPVNGLKIDRSFVGKVTTDAGGAAVTSSIVAIARNLGITTVAEGVETWEQFDFLENCRCDTLQGYLFSKPVSAAEFSALLREDRRLIR